MFCKNRSVFRNFAKFTGKNLCQSLFFKKVADLTFFTEHLRTIASRPKYTVKISGPLHKSILSYELPLSYPIFYPPGPKNYIMQKKIQTIQILVFSYWEKYFMPKKKLSWNNWYKTTLSDFLAVHN